jgi:hypothetical protein
MSSSVCVCSSSGSVGRQAVAGRVPQGYCWAAKTCAQRQQRWQCRYACGQQQEHGAGTAVVTPWRHNMRQAGTRASVHRCALASLTAAVPSSCPVCGGSRSTSVWRSRVAGPWGACARMGGGQHAREQSACASVRAVQSAICMRARVPHTPCRPVLAHTVCRVRREGGGCGWGGTTPLGSF